VDVGAWGLNVSDRGVPHQFVDQLFQGLQWLSQNHRRLNISVAVVSVLTLQRFDKDPVRHPGIKRVLGHLRRDGVIVLANGGNCRPWWTNCTGLPWPARVAGITPVGAATWGKNDEHRGAALKSLDSGDCEEELFAVCGAGYTSGALPVFAASVLLLLEAMDRAEYEWQREGASRHDAVLAILRKAAAPISPCASPSHCRAIHRKCSKNRYCIQLERALVYVLGSEVQSSGHGRGAAI